MTLLVEENIVTDTKSITDKAIVVTGGAGFIGSHLCDKLLSCEPAKILIIDDFSLGQTRNIIHLRKNPKAEITSSQNIY